MAGRGRNVLDRVTLNEYLQFLVMRRLSERWHTPLYGPDVVADGSRGLWSAGGSSAIRQAHVLADSLDTRAWVVDPDMLRIAIVVADALDGDPSSLERLAQLIQTAPSWLRKVFEFVDFMGPHVDRERAMTVLARLSRTTLAWSVRTLRVELPSFVSWCDEKRDPDDKYPDSNEEETGHPLAFMRRFDRLSSLHLADIDKGVLPESGALRVLGRLLNKNARVMVLVLLHSRIGVDWFGPRGEDALVPPVFSLLCKLVISNAESNSISARDVASLGKLPYLVFVSVDNASSVLQPGAFEAFFDGEAWSRERQLHIEFIGLRPGDDLQKIPRLAEHVDELSLHLCTRTPGAPMNFKYLQNLRRLSTLNLSFERWEDAIEAELRCLVTTFATVQNLRIHGVASSGVCKDPAKDAMTRLEAYFREMATPDISFSLFEDSE